MSSASNVTSGGIDTTGSVQYCGSAQAASDVAHEDVAAFAVCMIPLALVVVGGWVFYFAWHGTSRFEYYRSLKARFLWESRVQNICIPAFERGKGGCCSQTAPLAGSGRGERVVSTTALAQQGSDFFGSVGGSGTSLNGGSSGDDDSSLLRMTGVGGVTTRTTAAQRVRRTTAAAVLLVYRFAVWVAYCALWTEDEGDDGPVFFYYLTNWTFTMTWVYFMMATFISARGLASLVLHERLAQPGRRVHLLRLLLGLPAHSPHSAHPAATPQTANGGGGAGASVRGGGFDDVGAADPGEARLDCLGHLFALLYEPTVFQVAFVDALYWTLLHVPGSGITIHDAIVHGPLNAVLMLADLVLAPTPLCVANVATSGIFLMAYGLYTFVHYWSGFGCYPYDIVRRVRGGSIVPVAPSVWSLWRSKVARSVLVDRSVRACLWRSIGLSFLLPQSSSSENIVNSRAAAAARSCARQHCLA
jgi:hypothetical protein